MPDEVASTIMGLALVWSLAARTKSWVVLYDPAISNLAEGVVVPIATLPPFEVSMVNSGTMVVEVAILKALMRLLGMVLVADYWNASVSDAADDEANVMTFESR